jgi:hypothetical protein
LETGVVSDDFRSGDQFLRMIMRQGRPAAMRRVDAELKPCSFGVASPGFAFCAPKISFDPAARARGPAPLSDTIERLADTANDVASRLAIGPKKPASKPAERSLTPVGGRRCN